MKHVAALFLLFVIAACKPDLPMTAPENSVWLEKSKVWVSVGEVQQDQFRFYATIYDEEGYRMAEGWFLFYAKEPYEPKGVTKEYIEKYLGAYDGTALFIEDIAAGRSLSYVIQK